MWRSGETRLGGCVVLLGLVQIGLYARAITIRHPTDLFYFDPRIGLFVLEDLVRGREVFPGVSEWISAVALICVGILLVLGRVGARAYLRLELALAVPSMLFALLVVVTNLSSAHGFSIPELLIPVIVFLVFSAIPLAYAFFLARVAAYLALPGSAPNNGLHRSPRS